MEHLQEILISVGSAVLLWFIRKISGYLQELSRDFHTLRDLPERMEKLTVTFTEQIQQTKETQTLQGKQIQLLIEQLIEQGPPRKD